MTEHLPARASDGTAGRTVTTAARAGDRRPVVALALRHPAQQFAPAFRAAAKSSRVSVEVIYWDDHLGGHHDPGFGRRIDWDVDLHGGYSWHAPTGSPSVRSVRAWRLLTAVDPDVVVCFGWASAIARLAYVWATLHRTPVLFYGDSTWQHENHHRLWPLRSGLLRVLFRMSSGAISTGTFNREFYISLGMPPGHIRSGVCPVDVPAFEAARTTRPTRDVVRIGFAGKLIPRKGANELIAALASLRDVPGWQAEIIGDGPLRAELEEQVRALGLADLVRFSGFVNTARMPAALAGCDILVVPSTVDFRVMVTAEAMSAGCVTIVSSNTAVWGPGDLVEDGVTGCVYPSGDVASLAAILRDLLVNRWRREQLRIAGAERARRFGPDAFASTLEAAVMAVTG